MGIQDLGIVTLKRLAIDYVLHAYQIDEAALLSRRRDTRLVEARQMFAWMVKAARHKITYREMGEWLGGRDHSTMMDAHKHAILLRLRDPNFKNVSEAFLARYAGRQEQVREWLLDPEFDEVVSLAEELRLQAEESIHVSN